MFNNTFLDWIAHGIIDSIVDSFFPLLEEIEREILNIENFIFSEDDHLRLHRATTNDTPLEPSISSSDTAVSNDSSPDSEKEKASPAGLTEKLVTEKLEQRGTHRGMQFSVPKRHRLSLRRLKHFARVLSRFSFNLQVKQHQTPTAPNTVHRVAHVRRLVTSLSRFLATKSEVVAQVKKRILMTGEHGLGNGTGDDADVFVYMGDVQG